MKLHSHTLWCNHAVGTMWKIFILILFPVWQVRAQFNPDSLEHTGQRMLRGATEPERIQAGDDFAAMLRQTLSQPASFSYAFASVKSLSALEAPDHAFRIYTWNIPLDNGQFRIHGLIQIPAANKKPYRLISLRDQSADLSKPAFRQTDTSNWYGAIYYQIIRNTYRKSTWYTLLGINGHTAMSNKKIIDVLFIDRKGDVRLGAPIFWDGRKTKHRVIFEYAEKAAMSLRYQEKSGLIVFDHLSPPQPSLEGMYEFYGPDFTYDAYRFSKGTWKLIAGYEARNEGDNKGKIRGKPQRGLAPEK